MYMVVVHNGPRKMDINLSDLLMLIYRLPFSLVLRRYQPTSVHIHICIFPSCRSDRLCSFSFEQK